MESSQAEALLGLIHPVEEIVALSECEMVVEAVFEDRALKEKILKEVDEILPPEAVIASNTSTLPISGLASYTGREESFIGLHFFSPVEKMQLVEIILGKNTSDSTLAAAFDLVLQISKVPIVVRDGRGFYTSRVFQTYVLEGISMIAEGEDPARVESFALDAGMPVGPLALSDEVSLELMDRIITQTQKDLEAEGKTMPEHPGRAVVGKMVHEWGRLGKKNSKGFYEYGESRTKSLWSGIEEHFVKAESAQSRIEMQERFLFVQSIEALRCLEEGILLTQADGNIGSILGWGFAPFQGGVFRYVHSYGVEKFIARARELSTRYGSRFSPPEILQDRSVFPLNS
jgi:3-hydroxyacyl-CoA dehydrogenase/enoyl-CoA hydratase/3-hydroxybutyryl-CoA epimerase